MDQTYITYRLGIAIIIGLLIGLQREYVYDREKPEDAELFAGARTFALFAILGFLASLVSDLLASPAGYISIAGIVGLLIVISYVYSARNGNLGLTTEASAIITVVIGSLCYWDYLAIAGSVGVLSATLLTLKLRTQSLVDNLTREDIYATLKFAFISIIVLPLLPREGITTSPFDVIVPFNIWLMVVFISGIGFLGYALIKFVGVQKGVGLSGILGGLASSTAVTMSFSQRSREVEGLAHAFALAIMLSWMVMIARVAIEVLAVNAALMHNLWLPLLIVVLCTFAYSIYLFRASNHAKQSSPENFTNPFKLRPAIVFGLLYAGVLLGANIAQLYYGETGIYVSSMVSGLVDVDAITLSMANLSKQNGVVAPSTAARAIVLAVVSNTIVKGGIVVFKGSSALRKVIVPRILLISISAILSVFLLT